jgi:predicted transcriptional regulator
MKDLKHIKRFNESEENLNISDVISRFNFDIDTESKIIRYLELRGYIKSSKSYNFTSEEWSEMWSEMQELKDWLLKIGNEI